MTSSHAVLSLIRLAKQEFRYAQRDKDSYCFLKVSLNSAGIVLGLPLFHFHSSVFPEYLFCVVQV